jgi:hypothetical protein
MVWTFDGLDERAMVLTQAGRSFGWTSKCLVGHALDNLDVRAMGWTSETWAGLVDRLAGRANVWSDMRSIIWTCEQWAGLASDGLDEREMGWTCERSSGRAIGWTIDLLVHQLYLIEICHTQYYF